MLVETLGGDERGDEQRFERALERAAYDRCFDDGVTAGVGGAVRRTLAHSRGFRADRNAQHHLTFGYDVDLPIDEMERYVGNAHADLARDFGKACCCWVYGHLGDGNLHLNVWAPALRPDDAGRVAAIVYGALRVTLGSISAEHGIGLEKKAYLSLSRTPAIATMRLLKRALDPHNILNPARCLIW